MCGFTGFISCNAGIKVEKFISMVDCINHRGPDDSCILTTNESKSRFVEMHNELLQAPILVGFKRLSIRDVSANGRQPMVDRSSSVVIVFNGEIYNTDDLVNYLSDYKFNSSSDTEIILALYLKFGFSKMIKMLNGMFAICIIDLNERLLYMARDRMGIKPLYYYNNGNELIFASELKSFIYNDNFSREINYDALYEFFVFGDAINSLLLKNIREIVPGEYIVIKFNDSPFSEKHCTFFDINDYCRPVCLGMSYEESLKKTYRTLEEVVKRQLVSDVKVGLQLSGGVDSSLITYFSYKHGINHTVSINQKEKEYSEIEYINHVKGHLTGLTCKLFNLNSDYFADNFEKTVWHYENILTYHNVIALLGLSELAHNNNNIVLMSGEGADELFGGYTWFEDGIYASNFFSDPAKYSTPPMIRGMKDASTYSEFAVMATDTIEPLVSSKMFLSEIPYKEIKSKRIAYFDAFNGTDFDKHIKFELTTRLRSLLLRQDKMMMANSIENRVPMLDNEMIDLAFSLPQSFLMGLDGKPVGKKILKDICSEIYGRDFSYRRKMGLPIPIHKYMLNDRFKEYFYDCLLLGIKKRGLMNGNEIQRQYETMSETTNRWEYAPLWKALSFECWCQLFIDRRNICL